MDLSSLYCLKREGIKLGLEIMQGFAPLLGNPQDDFSSVHVAGTNGKGSTSAFIYNILRQKSSTGLYTSPHLVRFNERILLDREFIDDSYIQDYLSRIMPMVESLKTENRNPTFFEVTTMLAFEFFSRKKAKFAAIEVGLGGRLDSTNILKPIVSVICNIGYEHADRLGCSLDSISMEKGGIVKPGVPFVLADDKPEVVRTLNKISQLRGSPMYRVNEKTSVKDLKMDASGTSFTVTGINDTYDVNSRMLGEYTVRNISAAVLAVELLNSDKISRKEIEKGIREAVWPGRMEVISSEPFILIDCAHNPPAARSLVSSYQKLFKKKSALLVGLLSDKDWYTVIRTLSEIADDVVFTTPDEPKRAVNPETLQKYCGSFFKHSKVIPDIAEAYDYIRNNYDSIVITGSVYLVGKIKEIDGSNLYPFVRE